jgi:hypothetical protein
MASVAIIVSHGVSIRCFLMRWYHFSVEYFEDLRNINHVEFIVMRLKDNGRYALQNQLRTWSELKRERARRGSISGGSGNTTAENSIPTRRIWDECPDGCTSPEHNHGQHGSQKIPVRRNTADLFKDDSELLSSTPRMMSGTLLASRDFVIEEESVVGPIMDQKLGTTGQPDLHVEQLNLPAGKLSFSRVPQERFARSRTFSNRGRDGGGSMSGAPSPFSSEEDELLEEAEPPMEVIGARKHNSETTRLTPAFIEPSSLAKALRGELDTTGQVLADALGDQSDAEVEEVDMEMGDKERQKEEEDRILADERRERRLHRGNY